MYVPQQFRDMVRFHPIFYVLILSFAAVHQRKTKSERGRYRDSGTGRYRDSGTDANGRGVYGRESADF